MKPLSRRLTWMGAHAVLLSALVFCGCQSVPITIEENQLQGINKIGVVSIIGDEFSFVRIGPTFLNSKYKSYDIRDWKIDDFVTRTLKDAITSETSFQYVDVKYDPLTLRRLYDKRESISRFSDYDVNVIKNELRRIGMAHGVDTLILIAKTGRITRFDLRYDLDGLGVLQVRDLTKNTMLMANLAIKVIDVDTMEVLVVHRVPEHRLLENSRWTDDFSSLPLEERRFFEEATKESLDRRIPAQMTMMGLFPIPAGGLQDGVPCWSDDQCASQYCLGSVDDWSEKAECTPRPNKPRGADCKRGPECASGRCGALAGQPGRICD